MFKPLESLSTVRTSLTICWQSSEYKKIRSFKNSIQIVNDKIAQIKVKLTVTTFQTITEEAHFHSNFHQNFAQTLFQ